MADPSGLKAKTEMAKVELRVRHSKPSPLLARARSTFYLFAYMTSDQILESLILQFRRGLVLRRIGRLEEAQELLEVVVPAEVERWSAAAVSLRADQKKNQLRDIFQRELGRVEDSFLIYELLSERIEQEIVPAICNQVAAQVNAALAQYFTSVQEHAETPAEVPEPEPPAVVEKPQRRVPRQISFDDIPGMIDMLLEREYPRSRERE